MMWLGSTNRSNAHLGWQALLAAAGIALAVWGVIFDDPSYYCSGTLTGGPYAESDSTFCAVEWGRAIAIGAVGFLFLLAFIAAVRDQRTSRPRR